MQTPTPPRHKATPMIANTNTPVAPQTSASLNRRAVSGGKSSTHIPFRVLGVKKRHDTVRRLLYIRAKTLPRMGKGAEIWLRTLPSRLISGSGRRSTIGELDEEKLKRAFSRIVGERRRGKSKRKKET